MQVELAAVGSYFDLLHPVCFEQDSTGGQILHIASLTFGEKVRVQNPGYQFSSYFAFGSIAKLRMRKID